MSWFEDIGKKIKGFAIILFVLQIIFGFIGAISTWFDFMDLDEGGLGFLIALLIIFLTILVAYLSVMMLYAVGELVDTNMQLRDDVNEIKIQLNRIANNTSGNLISDNHYPHLHNTPIHQTANNTQPEYAPTAHQAENQPAVDQSKHDNLKIPYAVVPNQYGKLYCPHCGTEQNGDRFTCFKCGAIFANGQPNITHWCADCGTACNGEGSCPNCGSTRKIFNRR